MLRAQDGHRAIAAAIVDEHDFIGDAEVVEDRVQAREQGGERRLLVVYGNDDTE